MEKNLRSLQQIELGIFKEVEAICRRHGIPYYAMAGTALGAVRHKGFIPWDDDMDIGIPRPYYETFAEAVKTEAPAYLHLEFSKIGQLYRVLDTRVTMRVETFMTGTDSDLYSPFIDFLVIDGMPSGKIRRNLHELHYLFLRMLLKFHFIPYIREDARKRSGVEKLVIKTAKRLRLHKVFPYSSAAKRLYRCAVKYDYHRSDWCAVIGGYYRFQDIYPKAWMGNPKQVPFEDTQICLPEKYHEYLTSLYGDYMVEVYRQPHAIDLIEK